MILKRKHRLYVDVVFSKYITQREAAKGLQLILDERLDLQRAPVWAHEASPYIDRITIVERKAKK